MTEDLHHLAAAYALDAVDPHEARRFEAHLENCDHCAAELREFCTAAAQLATAAAVAPPPALRARVLAEAASTRQRSPQGTSLQHQRRAAPMLLAAAAAVLAVVLGAGLVVRDVAAERDAARELAAVLAAPDANFVPLEGEQAPAVVRVVWSASHGAAVLIGAGLPDPGPGRTYELWALADDGPRSAGVFEPGPDGRVERRLPLPAEPTGGWGVTIEPDGGSPEPTGDIVFAGPA